MNEGLYELMSIVILSIAKECSRQYYYYLASAASHSCTFLSLFSWIL